MQLQYNTCNTIHIIQYIEAISNHHQTLKVDNDTSYPIIYPVFLPPSPPPPPAFIESNVLLLPCKLLRDGNGLNADLVIEVVDTVKPDTVFLLPMATAERRNIVLASGFIFILKIEN